MRTSVDGTTTSPRPRIAHDPDRRDLEASEPERRVDGDGAVHGGAEARVQHEERRRTKTHEATHVPRRFAPRFARAVLRACRDLSTPQATCSRSGRSTTRRPGWPATRPGPRTDGTPSAATPQLSGDQLTQGSAAYLLRGSSSCASRRTRCSVPSGARPLRETGPLTLRQRRGRIDAHGRQRPASPSPEDRPRRR